MLKLYIVRRYVGLSLQLQDPRRYRWSAKADELHNADGPLTHFSTLLAVQQLRTTDAQHAPSGGLAAGRLFLVFRPGLIQA